MLVALFISPHAVHNRTESSQRGRPAEYPEGLTTKKVYTKQVKILSMCAEVYRAGENVVGVIEELSGLKMAQIDRLYILIQGQGLGIVEPLAKGVLPKEKVVWVLCKCVDSDARKILARVHSGHLNIIRAKSCPASEQMGEMAEQWLTGVRSSGPSRSRISGEEGLQSSRR